MKVLRWLRGATAIAEFLGPSGRPVHAVQSSYRAGVCLSCPLNLKLPWWRKVWFWLVAATAIRYLWVARKMKLYLPEQRKLGVCGACWCPLRLKVHVPLQHIMDYTDEEVLEQLPPECWMLNEEYTE